MHDSVYVTTLGMDFSVDFSEAKGAQKTGFTPRDRGTRLPQLISSSAKARRFPLKRVCGHLAGFRHRCCYCHRRRGTTTVSPTAIVALAPCRSISTISRSCGSTVTPYLWLPSPDDRMVSAYFNQLDYSSCSYTSYLPDCQC